MFRLSILALLASLIAYKYLSNPGVKDSPIVKTENGLLKGKVGISRDGKEFYEYLGIPYAKPPVSELRYESPQLPVSWEGIRSAQDFGSDCAQIDILKSTRTFNEDCLFLNVFTPHLKDDNLPLLPVMVFIHGGLYISHSASPYGGNYLIDEGVILVTMNYRLASLGFLNTGDGVIRGNMGLKDQAFALQWVQKNIEQFGGDKNQVTISGESAGAASVHHHILSPLSKGLFHRAISQSGTVLNSWANQEHPRAQAKRYAEQLNCPTEDSKEMVSCLKRVPVADILEVHSETDSLVRPRISLFGPTVETIKNGAFMSSNPYDTIRSGKVNAVPWLSGYNAEEGTAFFALIARNNTELEILESSFEEHLPDVIIYGHGDKAHRTQLAKKAKEFYFGNVKPDGFKTVQIYTKLFTDAVFAHGISESLKLHSEHQPVYPCYYSYRTDNPFASLVMSLQNKHHIVLEAMYYFAHKWINEKILGQKSLLDGAGHGDELILLFDMKEFGSVNPGDKDYEMSKSLVKLWASFTKGEKILRFRGKPLLQLEKNAKEVRYLKLDEVPELIREPNVEGINFWKAHGMLQ